MEILVEELDGIKEEEGGGDGAVLDFANDGQGGVEEIGITAAEEGDPGDLVLGQGREIKRGELVGGDLFFARDEAATDDLVCEKIGDAGAIAFVPEAVPEEGDEGVEWGIGHGGIVSNGEERGMIKVREKDHFE